MGEYMSGADRSKNHLTELKNQLFQAVTQSVEGEDPIAIAFSGGIDSSLLAQICKKAGMRVSLLTVGFHGSHDIVFSQVIALKLALPHKIKIMNRQDLKERQEYIVNKLECRIISHLENCVAFLYLANLAKEAGIESILTANGCDELFCGYDRFRSVYEGGSSQIRKLIREKITSELHLMNEVQMVTSDLGIKIKQPFLSEKFISFAMQIPIENKIKSCNDLIRKHILRQVALSIGVPLEAAMKPKKALQYGSLIHKNFKSM
jgi:asparagine synthase (glutamine-hydrolysing)